MIARDDRMAEAIDLINAALAKVQLGPVSPVEEQVLRCPLSYPGHLHFLELTGPVDLSEARSLIAQWHAWHGGS